MLTLPALHLVAAQTLKQLFLLTLPAFYLVAAQTPQATDSAASTDTNRMPGA